MAENTQNLNMQLVGTTPQDKAMSVVDWRTNLNGVTNSSLKKIDDAVGANPSTLSTTAKSIVPAINELDGDKYDNVVEDINAGTLTFSANGVDKKTVQTGNPNAVTVDGQKKSNIDFTCREVVRDGLVKLQKEETTQTIITTLTLTAGMEFTVCYEMYYENIGSRYLGTYFGGRYFVPDGSAIDTREKTGLIPYSNNIVIIKCKNDVVTWECNGVSFSRVIAGTTKKLAVGYWDATDVGIGYRIKNCFIYNRILTPHEISHNFQVLNNSPSINGLTTTDNTGAKQSYEFSTNSYQTTMASGDNLEQAYSGLLSAMGREYVAVEGKIEVNNGVEKSKVLELMMEGNTVKNYNLQDLAITLKSNYDSSRIYTVPSSIPQTAFTLRIRITKAEKASTSTGIDLSIDFLDGTGQRRSAVISNNLDLGIYEAYIVSSGVNNLRFITSSFGYGTLDYNLIDIREVMLIEGDQRGKGIKYFTGLSSTQAIINANGQDYTLYEPTIQGKTEILRALKGTQNWEVISADTERDTTRYDYKLESINGELGSVPSAEDYMDRASGIRYGNTKEIVLDGSENWGTSNTGLVNTLQVKLNIGEAIGGSSLISNNYVYIPANWEDIEHVIMNSSKDLNVYINRSKLTTQDVQGFKKWLQANPTTVRYQLATPTQTQLTAENLMAYDKYRKIIELNAV